MRTLIVEADDEYIGDEFYHIKCPLSCINPVKIKNIQGRAKSLEKTVNRRFKDWGILKQVYCHEIPSHVEGMYTITINNQMAIDNGKKFNKAFN